MKVEQEWQCPNCKYRYRSPIVLDYPTTHQCNPNVNRVYTMKLVSGDTDE